MVEHWMVWMRTAALPTFRKLWGRIEGDLKPGKYFYSIDNSNSFITKCRLRCKLIRWIEGIGVVDS
jgi:hypothetical protein